MTGHGGWPMTCVLDHDGEPFFAGTYFPDRPRHGQPAFRQVLQALADAWANRRDEVAGGGACAPPPVTWLRRFAHASASADAPAGTPAGAGK